VGGVGSRPGKRQPVAGSAQQAGPTHRCAEVEGVLLIYIKPSFFSVLCACPRGGVAGTGACASGRGIDLSNVRVRASN